MVKTDQILVLLLEFTLLYFISLSESGTYEKDRSVIRVKLPSRENGLYSNKFPEYCRGWRGAPGRGVRKFTENSKNFLGISYGLGGRVRSLKVISWHGNSKFLQSASGKIIVRSSRTHPSNLPRTRNLIRITDLFPTGNKFYFPRRHSHWNKNPNRWIQLRSCTTLSLISFRFPFPISHW